MRITKIPGQIAESALSIFGIRIGTEEPHYLATPVTDEIELRTYGPRIAAETTVAADEDRARNIGFRRLANYIFGGTTGPRRSSMTAPVAQQSDRGGDEIAMTAPVSPVTRNRRQLDHPVLHAVQVDDGHAADARQRRRRVGDVPGETVAVLRFAVTAAPPPSRPKPRS